jgi:HEAT repeat protein
MNMRKSPILKSMAVVILLAAALAVSGLGRAAEDPGQSDETKLYQQAYNLVLAEKWGEAKASLESFLQKYPKSSWADDARYWICYSREQNDENRETVFRCYQDFIKAYPDSAWLDDAKANMIHLAERLADRGRKEYRAIIEAYEKSENEDIQITSLYALGRMKGDAGMNALLDLYDKNADAELRAKIIYVFGQSEDEKSLAKLSSIALKDASEILRKKAVNALGERGGPEAARVLLSILESGQPAPIRKAAASALRDLEEPGIAAALGRIALNDPDAGLAAEAAEAVSDMDHLPPAEKFDLARRILKESKVEDVRLIALSMLSRRDLPDALPLLKETALGAGGERLRKTAIEAIGESRNDKALDALKDIFGTIRDREMKSRVLSVIAQRGGSEALSFLAETAINLADEELASDAVREASDVENEADARRYALLNILRKSKSSEVKQTAISCLVDEATPENIKALGQYLATETDPELRQTACESLGETENDEAVPILLEIAKNDKDMDTKRAATRALGEIASPKAQNALMELLKKKDGIEK